MTDEIRPATTVPTGPPRSDKQTPSIGNHVLVPMRVGQAIVYIEQSGDDAAIQDDGAIYPVSPRTDDAFKLASEVIRDSVHVLGQQIDSLGEHLPEKLEIKFCIDLQVRAKAMIIPVFVTGESGLKAALKVKATWGT